MNPGDRVAWVVRVAIVGCVVLNLEAFRAELRTAADRHDVAASQAGLEELRRFLPASGRVGYVTDGAPTDVLGSSAATGRYYLTQYALAPLVVEPGTAPDLVVGNFEKLDPASIPDTLVLVRSFGGGLMLFRKRTD